MTQTIEILDNIKHAIHGERVFSEPVTHDGITVIPASSVTGGGGAGGGEGDAEGVNSGSGDGGGFGVIARPAGALIITDGRVRWKPTIDFTRVILGGQAIGMAYFVSSWLIERSKANAAVKIAKLAGRDNLGPRG